MPSPTTIYRYGPAAWLWRALLAAALAGGALLLWLGAREASAALVAIAAILLAPSLFFGFAVAALVRTLGDGRVEVRTLLLVRRRIPRERLGAPRLRERYESEQGPMYAPRLWVPVRGSVPVYLDLLGGIPDRRAFGDAFRVPVKALPR